MPNARKAVRDQARARRKAQLAAARRNRGPRQSAPGQTERDLNRETLDYAKLLSDPCMSRLTQPLYGASEGGYMARLSRTLELDTNDSYSSGYCIWFPDYTGDDSSSSSTTRRSCNFYTFQSVSGSSSPTNTNLSPFGASSFQGISGKFIQDPATGIVESTLVQDSRTAAACIKFSYTGRNDALSGRVGYLNNIPREALLTGGGGGPPSPQELITYADVVGRTPMDTLENKFRPSAASQYYRTTGTITDSAAQWGNDACFLSGVPGSSTTEIASDIASGAGAGIGYVWLGLPTDSSMVIEAHKVIEWRPDMSSTLVSPPPTSSANGMNVVTRAISYLDHKHPGWQRQVLRQAASAAARIAGLAFGGPANLGIRSGVQMLMG